MIKNNSLILFIAILVLSCGNDDISEACGVTGDLSDISFDPQSYTIPKPSRYPSMLIPADNLLTVEGIELGRYLFYDPILSADSTMSCGSCHKPELSFTDGGATSVGIDGISGRRSSMSLLNIGYAEKGVFWDGRVNTLEEQALAPVEDPIELHESWENVESKLKAHPSYPEMFRKAFGIADRNEITKELAAKAIAQFERTLISTDSKYDKVNYKDQAAFNPSEERGIGLYEGKDGFTDAHCSHCHGIPHMTSDKYANNGLDSVRWLVEFSDLGVGGVTQDTFDNGLFRAPTLRNIALTAPYMHDGRFQTLEEVIDFYNESPNHNNGSNVDNDISPLGLTQEEKLDLINFLHALTDTTFTKNPAFQSPF